MLWLSRLVELFLKAKPEPWADLAPLSITADGWLEGDGVTLVKSDPSWWGGPLKTGAPTGVVCHVSATKAGTALNMAKRRARKFGTDPDDRLSSWHASVESSGALVQMVSFRCRAFHAGSPTSKVIPGLGWANSCTTGIELIGFEKGPFPEAQVAGYARLLRALHQRYGIRREHAMITHQSIDPTRRSDPGRVWMRDHAEAVLAYAYGA
jgi:hypothetical protein